MDRQVLIYRLFQLLGAAVRAAPDLPFGNRREPPLVCAKPVWIKHPLRDVAWGNGRFVAVGWNGTIVREQSRYRKSRCPSALVTPRGGCNCGGERRPNYPSLGCYIAAMSRRVCS